MIMSINEIKELLAFANDKKLELLVNVNRLKHMDKSELDEDISADIGFSFFDGMAKVTSNHMDSIELRSVEDTYKAYVIHLSDISLCVNDFKVMLPLSDYTKARKMECVHNVINN